MHIVSWNVAGLSTTLARIDADYGCAETAGSSKNTDAQSSFAKYLERHEIDILAVQEHKIPLTKLKSRSEPFCVASRTYGYDSFWSCNTSAKAGMNGVCTFARTGFTISASSAPLGCASLDSQGRCVMTDHGSFVLFNVYVPCQEGENKAKFLEALRRAMSVQRNEFGKKVLLVGDLNIAHRPIDRFWKWRPVSLSTLFDLANSESDDNKIGDVERSSSSCISLSCKQICSMWPLVEETLKKRKIVKRRTQNPTTKELFDKFQVSVVVGNRTIFLGRVENTEEEADACYNLFQTIDSDSDGNVDKIISIEVLFELMSKICGKTFPLDKQRLIAESVAVELVWKMHPSKIWLDSLINEEGMVDAFRLFYPETESRFTIWHQYTNRRYDNEGSRIDYTLVDKGLVEQIERGSHLRCGCANCDLMSFESAALCAATANGSFQAASFGGNGIAPVSQRILDKQFGTQHTGIIYTPPSYSDHVAVALILNVKAPCLHLDTSDKKTKISQPHKCQQSMTDFFKRNTNKKNVQKKDFNKCASKSKHRSKASIKNFFSNTL